MRHEEAVQQRLFVKRVRLDARTKDLLFTSVPLGGYRNTREAALLKAEGANAGCPDLLFFEAGHCLVGLALEFKRAGGKQSVAQRDWSWKLTERFWQYSIVYSAADAWDHLMAYLGLDP